MAQSLFRNRVRAPKLDGGLGWLSTNSIPIPILIPIIPYRSTACVNLPCGGTGREDRAMPRMPLPPFGDRQPVRQQR